jgi:hypothetical protein
MGVRSVCRPGVIGFGLPELPGALDHTIFDRMEELRRTCSREAAKECSPGRKPWEKSRKRVSPVRDESNEVDIPVDAFAPLGLLVFLQLTQD